MENDTRTRCSWCGDDPTYVAYHDREWGVPCRDGRTLWEMLVLEGFQSGLSWITILRKRDGFRRAFAGFDPERVAAFAEADIARCLADAGIVRHRGKIEGAVASARAYLAYGGDAEFATFVWSFVGGQPVNTRLGKIADAVSQTEASTALSKALRKRGFAYCGPTTVYAFMQAAGLVNDHVTDCFRHAEVGAGVTHPP